MEKQDVLKRDFGMSTWPRYDYDVDAGTLIFSKADEAKVIADIQVVGTTGRKDWLWGLANSHWPASVVKDMESVRQFGHDNGIEELTTDYLEDEELNSLGWEMTAVAVRILGAVGAYRSPSEDRAGALFLLIKSINYVS